MTAPDYMEYGEFCIVRKGDGWYWHILVVQDASNHYYGGPFSTYVKAYDAMLEAGAEFNIEVIE